jgi:hypothetical protein
MVGFVAIVYVSARLSRSVALTWPATFVAVTPSTLTGNDRFWAVGGAGVMTMLVEAVATSCAVSVAVKVTV